ncbi:hypothetical protein WA026_005038 [Henosepilachna vigintioctopunctata]|uniref:Uncharacterized protein n=1 Tax=Henosepilachna vigintioctopunctata TaxID=420089 RepID=A0AAW1USF3_9CUCU
MKNSEIKRVCICEDDPLPVIIKINPCPGKSCQFAKKAAAAIMSESLSFSLNLSSESKGLDLKDETNISMNDKSSWTSNGKVHTASETEPSIKSYEKSPKKNKIHVVNRSTSSVLIQNKSKVGKEVTSQ